MITDGFIIEHLGLGLPLVKAPKVTEIDGSYKTMTIGILLLRNMRDLVCGIFALSLATWGLDHRGSEEGLRTVGPMMRTSWHLFLQAPQLPRVWVCLPWVQCTVL